MKKTTIMRFIVASVVALSAMASHHAMALPLEHYASSSKLASGRWVKIAVTESGIHQITDADAKSWGFGSAQSLHVFGTGGAGLSETLTSDIPDDLPQLPVVRAAGKLLFYAQGPVTWQANKTGITFEQVHNPYSNKGYYFVTDSEEYQDITAERSEKTAAGEAVTTFTERLYHEVDITNPSETGRVYLGEDFMSNAQQTYNFKLTGHVSGTKVNALTVAGVCQQSASGSGSFTFQANGTNLPKAASDQFSYSSIKYQIYQKLTMLKTFDPNSEDLSYTVKLNLTNALLKIGRLDYITVNYERALALSNGQIAFATPLSWTEGTPMSIAGATSSTVVWDVTVPHAPVQMATTVSGSGATIVTGASHHEYVAFNPEGSYVSPKEHETVANQNIHAMSVPDLIIITHSRYMVQAQRLADLHADADTMRVLVLSQDDVFNEFSSGTPDAMAYRMVCKYFYDRGTDGGHHLQHALLMGNGTYDNRQISSEFKSIAYPAVLTWQSPVSYTENGSYCVDNHMGMLVDGAGNNWGAQEMKIGVGRLPVKSESEAEICVNKIINYVTSPKFGAWRTKVLVIADDEEKASFMKDCETYIESARSTDMGNSYMYKRIYLDAYDAVSVGSTRSYPGARNDFYGGLKDGALVWCYNGHASPNVISGHNFVRRNDFLDNMYYNHLPLMMGTSCEVARFDAIDDSGGELMMLNKNGGAIAVMSTNRQAYMHDNALLGKQMFKNIFDRDKDGQSYRLGDIFKMSLNSTKLSNNQAYMLMGDPAMRLTQPLYKARIETINGQSIDTGNKPVFKARQKVTFTGSIVDRQGKRVEDFNGTVLSSLYDCDQSVTTHAYGEGSAFTYQEHSNRIAIGSDSVSNGQFKVTLTIPSEIMYSFDNYTPSLVSVYAQDNAKMNDAMGSCEDFYIYGYDETVPTDTLGPEIMHFGLNSEDFKNGGDCNESPLVVATLFDRSGINLSDAGIGHAMTLTLDGETQYSDVSKYYTPIHCDDGYKGSISYPLSDLGNGMHTLRLRAWDVYNNMNEMTLNFNVVRGLKPQIAEVYVTNNPASTETTFYVKHNRPDAKLNVGIQVYDIMGRLVWSTQQSGQSDKDYSFPVTWNLTDLSGNRVHRGIYVYRATISTDGVREATKSKKLAVTGE